MRKDAIALTLIMIFASLTGCLGEDVVDIEEDPNDPNPTGDIGFMDNSSVYGFRFNGTTLERVMVITEDACDVLIAEAAANTEADYDIHWDSTENVCFGWIAFESASHPSEIHVYDLQEEEVINPKEKATSESEKRHGQNIEDEFKESFKKKKNYVKLARMSKPHEQGFFPITLRTYQ